MENKLLIERYDANQVQTLGRMHVVNAKGAIQKSFYSLELPWKYNRKRVSCIPEGDYTVVKHTSPKFGACFHIQSIPNRSEVLIHAGNYHTQILGCILPGLDLKDLNNDHQLDVTSSKAALKELLALLPSTFQLTIKSILK